VLVVEPDYLPDSEVLYFQPCLYPMKYLHPRSMYTLPCGGVQRGGTPSVGSGGSMLGGLGARGPRMEECTYFWGVNTSWGIDTASGGSGGEAPEAKIAL
jgi:hypothetical protein